MLPDYVSLLEWLKRAGRQLDTEKLVEALETVRDFDMGLGAPISFGPTEHQGLHKVWGTQSTSTAATRPLIWSKPEFKLRATIRLLLRRRRASEISDAWTTKPTLSGV